jgi:putative ABC transport system permease protein
VDAAGFKNPLLGGWQTAFYVEGTPEPKPGQQPSVDIGRITSDSLRALGIRLLKGRFFNEFDNENALKVCIVDETMASTYWPGDDPIGKRISIGGPPPAGQQRIWWTVVGVVKHVKHYGVDQDSRVEMYVPNAQNTVSVGNIVLRTSGDPASLGSALRSAVLSIDPDMPIFNVRPLMRIVEDSTAQRRISVILLSVFAALAMLLAAVGIYGVMSYSVAQRSHEIGIRMALGASRADVFRLIIGSGFVLAVIGVVIGLVLGLGSAHFAANWLSTLLFNVKPMDLTTFAAIPFVLCLVALLACWVPARRATRVDPLVALRYE